MLNLDWTDASLAFGLIVGAALALSGAAERVDPPLRDDEAARVNGTSILRRELRQALAARGSKSKEAGVSDGSVLRRLIDEELLVQRALSLGLATRDRQVRIGLSAAMLELFRARAEQTKEPGPKALATFYEGNQARFSPAQAIRLRHYPIARAPKESLDDYRRRAAEALAALRLGKGDFKPRSELPDRLLPLNKLRDYLGDSLSRQAAAGKKEGMLGPIEVSGHLHILHVLERRVVAAPPLDRVRERVLRLWRRREAERRLRTFLLRARSRARIKKRKELP
jgi:hypothetical protein